MSEPLVNSSVPPQGDPAYGHAHRQMRIFQAFVNVEGLRLRVRRFFGWLELPTFRRYGFFSVILLAADADAKPPLLLSLAKDTLITEFSPLTSTPTHLWRVRLEDWRMVGAAPPFFQQPGCIDSGWGAAWYDINDPSAKGHRYRLAKLRLWKGRRAKQAIRPVVLDPSVIA
jgi:hypothetical protein